MKNKPYRFGLLVGRFQILHLGHEEMIRRALEVCDEVGIFVGSSQESHTWKNPFTYEERKNWILKSFPEVEVRPLEDQGLGNVLSWGDFVYEETKKQFHKTPDLFITGREERRTTWFRDSIPMTELLIPKTIVASSTEVKEFLLQNDFKGFSKMVHPLMKEDFEFMKERVISCQEKNDTKSI